MNRPPFPSTPPDLFGSTYRELVASVREPASPVVRPTVRERLVRCIWFDQEFKGAARTEAGQALTVLSPGWWNLESGPDFRNAALKFSGGKPVKGDVEVHTYASGWTQHEHHRDEAYNNVVLHVVMWNDTGRPTTTRQDGTEIPILALDRLVHGSVDELTEAVAVEDHPVAGDVHAGRCQELLSCGDIDPDWIGQFLDHAGDERMLRKAERFRQMPEAADTENILYISVMEALGYKKNKKPMGRLALLVPPSTARRLLDDGGVGALQAALFGMAGLMPKQPGLPGTEPDAETAAYTAELRGHWARIDRSLAEPAMPPTDWAFSGTRPANYPTRRIAAASRLLEKAAASGGLVPVIERALRRSPAAPSRRVARGPAAKAVIDLLTGLTDDYWSWRTMFGGKKLTSKTRLIGADRATVLFVDAIVPILLAHARSNEDRDLENRLHRAYATLPLLPVNSVLTFMASRIFGGEAPASEIVTSARRQQGLLQLFRDTCETGDTGCRRCPFASALEGT